MNNNKFLRDYTEKVYSIEQAREESLITQSGRMITVQGLLLTIISLLLSNSKVGKNISFSDFKWILLSIIVSLLLAFLVQVRIPKRAFPKIEDIEKKVNENSNVTDIQTEEVNDFYHQKTKVNNSWLFVINQIRSVIITLSSVSFITGIVLLIVKLFELI